MIDDTEDEGGEPRDLPAERAALGAMMLSTPVADQVADMLMAEDFHRGAHAVVYDAIQGLRERGEPHDALAVNAELARTGTLGRAGGPAYLHTLLESVPTAANGPYYAAIVRDKAILRRLVIAGRNITGAGYAAERTDIGETLDYVRRELEAATERGPASAGPVAVPDLVDDALGAIEKPTEHRRGIPTGLTDLDDLYGGHQAGRITVIGARPGVGKSVLALTMLRNAATSGVPGLLLSLEMGREEIMQRVVSAEAGVSLDNIREGACGEFEWARIAKAAPRLAEMPLWIDDESQVNLAGLWQRVRHAQRAHGVRLVAIDYLQLLQAPKAESRQYEIAKISRELKLMAQRLDVAIVLLVQLNRESDKRADKRPQMSDIRESGAIEQDADTVMLLHQPSMHGEEHRAGELDVHVPKQRAGRLGEATVVWQGHYARCVSMARDAA